MTVSSNDLKRNAVSALFAAGLVLFSAVGCNFTKPATEKQSQVSLGGSTLEIHWRDPGPDRFKISPKVVLNQKALSLAESDLPITMPEEVPSEAVFHFGLKDAKLASEVDFAIAKIRSEGSESELPVEFLRTEQSEDGTNQVSLRVDGFRSAFPRNKSETKVLAVDLYHHDRRLATFDVSLRTPPSVILKGWGTQKELWEVRSKEGGVPEAYFAPKIAQSTFVLIGSVIYQNGEDSPIRIEIPRELSEAGLIQRETTRKYIDNGCRNEVRVTPSTVVLGNSLILLPLDNTLPVVAEETIKFGSKAGPLRKVLKPQERVQIGVFTIGAEAETWANSGPFLPDFTVQRVPHGMIMCTLGLCRNMCLKTSGSDAISEMDVAIAGELKREYHNETLGTKRELPELTVDLYQIRAHFGFIERPGPTELMTRTLPAFPKEFEVKHFSQN